MIKKLEHSLTGTFSYMFHEDDAVDTDHDDFDKVAYEEDFDEKHLPLLEGAKPTKFVCKPLTRRMLSLVLDIEGAATAQTICVAGGLRQVDDPGEVFDLKRKQDRLTEKSMDSLHKAYGIEVLSRVGAAILKRSRISPL